MKEQQFQQFAIVQGNTASDLTDKLNSKLLELKDKEPVNGTNQIFRIGIGSGRSGG